MKIAFILLVTLLMLTACAPIEPKVEKESIPDMMQICMGENQENCHLVEVEKKNGPAAI